MIKITLIYFAFYFCTIQFAIAQTSGPSTPEVQKFTPSSSKNLVNLFTGDLNYNIDLLNLDGGYPINISYSSVVGMTQEASSVGFGWQLNLGRINRVVRGLPDDFDGDIITKKLYQKPELDIGIGVGIDAELFGIPILRGGATTGLTFSNMRGVDIQQSIGASISTSISGVKLSGGLTLGMNSSQEGATISPNVGLQFQNFSLGAGTKISSNEGMGNIAFNANYRRQINPDNEKSAGSQENESENPQNSTYQESRVMTFPLVAAKSSFIPRIDFPTSTISGSFHFRVGAEAWGVSPGGQIYGQFSKQSYPQQQRNLNSFGYLYLQDKHDNDAIMDIGTEKESPIFEEDKDLSLSYLANDVFLVSAQGLSETFRPFRTDIGIGHTENQMSNDNGASLGGEIHLGGYYHGGIDVTANLTSIYSGEWADNNQLFSKLEFHKTNENPPVYFKNVGETNLFRSEKAFSALGGFEPAAFNIQESSLTNILNTTAIDGQNSNKQIEHRNTNFQYLTAGDAKRANIPLECYTGHEKSRKVMLLERATGYRNEHHISYITITKDDGTIYEFGIAAYNVVQKEVTFSVNGKNEQNLFTKKTIYTEGADNSPSNPEGLYNLYSSTETPAYAYAYFLTAVYSPDYQDLTGNGPTPDDLGKYTKFNYTLEHTHFRWRTPYDSANYNARMLSDKDDDMGSYIYGEKEIWIINSIETKNYIAEFYSNKREDAFEVAGENGGLDPNGNQLLKVDSIKLFSRANFNTDNAIAIKSIFFKYNYALCPRLPSNKSSLAHNANDSVTGKLTLEKISFSYDKSEKEKNSFYSFAYNNEADLNYRYDERSVDFWGTFKANPTGSKFNNIRFPYSNQNKKLADGESQAWQLNQIILPTGGLIKIEYEAKDYAFVEDKLAMRMYKVIGFSKDGSQPDINLYDNSPNNYLTVDLEEPVTNVSLNRYFRPGEKIYVNCLLNIGKHNILANDYEETDGYFNADRYETVAGHPTYVKILLKDINGLANPMSRALWQKMRKSLTKILYPPPITDPTADIAGNIVKVVKEIPIVLGSGFLQFLQSYESKMINDQRGISLRNEIGSFARLYDPDGHKIGGGSRVKKILLYDNWEKMTGDPLRGNYYGQEYTYSKKIINNKDTTVISSGVASYEPIGNEENPFVKPTQSFNGANVLAPELYYYKLEPFGESFFPAPSIGYSNVKVVDLHDARVNNNATGFETFEFYTYRDFPVIAKRTAKQGIPSNISIPFVNQKKYTASQGFSVELNDMNGKLRAHKIFSQLDSLVPLSGIEYKYKILNGMLDNWSSVIDPSSGKIDRRQLVGIDYDFFVNTYESRSLTKSPSLQLNVDIIPLILGAPFPFPMLLPSYSENLLQFRGATTTKIIFRAGILDTTITYDNGTQLISNNILFDAVSGRTVLTAIQNEYNEPVYKTEIPAYWYYPQMGAASINSNQVFQNFTTAQINNFNQGDELVLDRTKAWVFENMNSTKSKFLISESGDIIAGNNFNHVVLIRSGRKNIQSVIGEEIISKSNPIATDLLTFDRIIDASATRFKNHWQTYYGVHPLMAKDSCDCITNKIRLPNYLDRIITFNPDGSVYRPANASIDGTKISLKDDTCEIQILLDHAISTCPDSLGKSRLIFDILLVPTLRGDSCETSYPATGTYSFYDNCGRHNPVKGTFVFKNSCLPAIECHNIRYTIPNPIICEIGDGQQVNPYLLGILGNWRPESIYKYITDRKYDGSKLLQHQGVFDKFDHLLKLPFDVGNGTDPDKWQGEEFATIVDPHGMDIETLNALKISQSRIAGYGYSIPVAIAHNSNYYEIGFDGFEDYDYLKQINSILSECALPAHFKFKYSGTGSNIVDSVSHTGMRSLIVTRNDSATMEREINQDCNYPYTQSPYNDNTYHLNKCDVVKEFSPQPGKKYIVNLWIKESRLPDQLDKSTGQINLDFFDLNNKPIGHSIIFKAKGPLIDDWQQLSESFFIPMNSKKIKITLSTTANKMFVDDIRIEPFETTMNAYVYNPFTLRLMAALDEQNFATFYEYDSEGQLTRINRETEKGILTIQEIRSAKPKIGKLNLR